MPYVRCLIRGRGSRAFFGASVTWHVVAVVITVVIAYHHLMSVWVAVLFAEFAVRSIAIPLLQERRGTLPPALIGIPEMVRTILLSLALIL